MSTGTWGVWCEVWGGVTGSRCAWMKGDDGAVLIVQASSDDEAEARARVLCARAFWGTMGNSAFLMVDGPDAYRQARREWRDGLTVEVHGLA